MAVLVEERDREKKGCQQVPPWWLGWKKVPGANFGSGLVFVGIGDGNGTRQRFRHMPRQAGVDAWLVRAFTWTREWAWHFRDVDVELETDSERQDAFF